MNKMNKWLKAGLILLILFLLFIPSIFILKGLAIHQIYSYYVDSVSSLTGLNKYLVKMAVILMIIPFLIGIKFFFFSPFNKIRKYTGAAIIVTIILLYNLGLYGITKNSYFDFSEGKASKWYANTPEGIRFFDSAGSDPKYGIKLKAVTPQLIANLEKMKRGMEPKRLIYDSLDEVELFDRITGDNRVWYYKDSSGNYELFTSAGIHPTYGETLKPVTREIILQIKTKLDKDKRKRQEEFDRQTVKRAVQKRDTFLNHYLLSRSFLNQPESTEVAILVIDEERKAQDIDQRIASLLKNKGLNTTASLFSGRFVSDGKFERIFNGDASEIKKLELSKHCDHIVLGKSSVNFTQNSDMQDMITARASIEFRIISAKTGTIENRFTLTEAGAGFSKADAEEIAMERILGKIENRILNAIA